MSGTIICAGLIKHKDKILLVQENKTHIEDKWSLPAGRLEYGEKLSKCVRREVFEETGLDSKPIGIIGIYFTKSNNTIIIYKMKVLDSNLEPQSNDVKDAKMVPISEIESYDLRSNYILKVLEDYEKRDLIPIESIENIGDVKLKTREKLKLKLLNKIYTKSFLNKLGLFSILIVLYTYIKYKTKLNKDI